MPFCERGSAHKLTGKISEPEAWNFLHDIAAGLSYLHAQNPPVIHQDIKPDNVMIDNNGRFMITDFGISANMHSALRKTVLKLHTSVGTTAYMAPERFDKENYPNKASDVWALGATMYELLSGAPPFGEYGGLMLKKGADIPEIRSSSSLALKNIVERCLQNEIRDRMAAEEIVNTVEQYNRGIMPAEKKFCKRCGKEISQNNIFCRYCGKKQK
jgi:serine/threonine protein kinase